MPRAGFCDQCGTNVWVNPDGSCANGHTADHVSGIYEADVPAPVAVAAPVLRQPPPTKRGGGTTVAIILAVVLVFGCMMCGIVSAIAVPVFNAAKGNALTKSCYAYERAMDGAVQTYYADKGVYPTSLDDLVKAGLFPKVPTCPGGGTYTYDPKTRRVTCSKHGSYFDVGAPPAGQ